MTKNWLLIIIFPCFLAVLLWGCTKTDSSNQPTGLVLHFFDQASTAGINNLQVTFYNNDTDLKYDMNAIAISTSTGNGASFSATTHVYTNYDGEVTITGLTNSAYSVHAIDTSNSKHNSILHINNPLALHVNNSASFYLK